MKQGSRSRWLRDPGVVREEYKQNLAAASIRISPQEARYLVERGIARGLLKRPEKQSKITST
jgi:hypothetical protein